MIHDRGSAPPSLPSSTEQQGRGWASQGAPGGWQVGLEAVYHLPANRTGKDPGSRPFLDTCPRVWSGKESRKGALLGVLRPLRAPAFCLDMEGI